MYKIRESLQTVHDQRTIHHRQSRAALRLSRRDLGQITTFFHSPASIQKCAFYLLLTTFIAFILNDQIAFFRIQIRNAFQFSGRMLPVMQADRAQC